MAPEPEDPILSWLRAGVVGRDAPIRTPFGTLPKRYLDDTASGLPFGPIEDLVRNQALSSKANTHTDASAVGGSMMDASTRNRPVRLIAPRGE